MAAVRSVNALIGALEHGSADSLRALALALAATVHPVADAPVEPADVYASLEDRPAVEPGTWQEVAAARDDGRLTVAEYDYLAAAVDALTQEDA